ncbi:TetR/AcrR family transcriptional regulator [Gordonia sp. WA4-43]|uniref:TetR/AcrR family transcriptional regulator n=1 Tax=Gordonia sp. WA4-43 TaxID=2878678 RepID=UPI001CF9D6F2|nr:TetR/AcrR family transcriptional regulator [Gordonia sp. WA4-43]UCZ89590.1 TetR/AcrR family transcriptional regulator [Gordonia sp. WA4-43]
MSATHVPREDESGNTNRPPTRRTQAKAARRAELLSAAAHQMAERGFAGVRLEDIGRAVGVSGPAMYRHFSSKTELLDEMLIDISQRLHDGGSEVADRGGSPTETLVALIGFHIDVLVTRPDLITVQDRDLPSMTPDANHRVRLLQRRYVERWVDVLLAVVDENGGTLDREEARVRVHAMFGLLNSSPRLPAFDQHGLRRLLTAMALAALRCEVPDQP